MPTWQELCAAGEWREHMPGRWATYNLLSRVPLPRFAGTYAVYLGEALIYVGQSCDIANRFCGHNIRYGYGKNIHTPWGSFPDDKPVRLKVKRSRVIGDWAMWEIRLIKRLLPPCNDRMRGRKVANG